MRTRAGVIFLASLVMAATAGCGSSTAASDAAGTAVPQWETIPAEAGTQEATTAGTEERDGDDGDSAPEEGMLAAAAASAETALQETPDELISRLVQEQGKSSSDWFLSEDGMTDSAVEEPVPDSVYGFVNGVRADLDGDGTDEVVTLSIADERKLRVDLYRYRDGAYVLAGSGDIAGIDPYTGCRVSLYQSASDGTWYLFLDSFMSNTPADGTLLTAKLYAITEDGLNADPGNGARESSYSATQLESLTPAYASVHDFLADWGVPCAVFCCDYGTQGSDLFLGRINHSGGREAGNGGTILLNYLQVSDTDEDASLDSSALESAFEERRSAEGAESTTTTTTAAADTGDYCRDLAAAYPDFSAALAADSPKDGGDYYSLTVNVRGENEYAMTGEALGTTTVRIRKDAKVLWRMGMDVESLISLDEYAQKYYTPSFSEASTVRIWYGQNDGTNQDYLVFYDENGYITQFYDGLFE